MNKLCAGLAGLVMLGASCVATSELEKPKMIKGYSNSVDINEEDLTKIVDSVYRLDCNALYANDEHMALRSGHGSAFVGDVKNDRQYFVTCYHVVNPPERVGNPVVGSIPLKSAAFSVQVNGESKPLELVLWNEEKDIAILKSKEDLGLKREFEIASRRLAQGDVVYAVGFPFNIGSYVSKGVVGNVKDDVVMHSAFTNPGMSGGLLYAFDNGKPVIAGVNRFYVRNSQGMFGVVPANTVRDALRQIK